MTPAIRDGAPPGFRYIADLLTAQEEAALVSRLRTFELAGVQMRGRVARRRTIHFGWIYGYESWRITPGPPVPQALQALRARAATLARVEPEELAEVLVTEYPPGAGIGWHRDARQFGAVIGVSLLGPCRMRFQHGAGADRQTRGVVLQPRSAYVLDGEARWHWQHCIPPVRTERYSITFRALSSPGPPT